MTFITGAFNATFAGFKLGVTEDGFEQVTSRVQEDITCDQYRGALDGIFQGINMQIRMVLMELDLPGVRRLLWPYDHLPLTDSGENEFFMSQGKVGPVGTLLSQFAAPLVLTPCPGTSAALVGNPKDGGELDNITYPRCVLSADPQAVKFSSSLRKLPVTLTVLPVTCPLPDLDDPDGASVGPACDGWLTYYVVDLGQVGPVPDLCTV